MCLARRQRVNRSVCVLPPGTESSNLLDMFTAICQQLENMWPYSFPLSVFTSG